MTVLYTVKSSWQGAVDLLLLPRSASTACREKAGVSYSLKSMRESPSPSWTFSCFFYVNAIVSIGYWFFSSSNMLLVSPVHRITGAS